MSSTVALSDLFLVHLDSEQRAELAATPNLDGELATLWSRAREPWPEVHLLPDDFFPFLARRLLDTAPAGVWDLRVEDLYLLCAYVRGNAAAAVLFEARYMKRVQMALHARRVTSDVISEVQQTLRERVLLDRAVDPERRHYAGAGDLAAWLCVSGVREAGRLMSRARREETLDGYQLANLPACDDDQELAYLKLLYRREFKEAFDEALASLEPRERNVLRYSVLQGVSIDRIGLIYGVHRATVARWIAQARQVLLRRTREALTRRLHGTDVDFASILRLIESELDVSLRRRLRG